MKNKLVKIAIFAALIATVVVVILKLLGHDNPTVTGGAVAGGVIGALAGSFGKKSNQY